MKIAFLTTDNREHYLEYQKPDPYFGTAPQALLEGFASLPDIEVHVVCCFRQPSRAPEKLAPNIFYHQLIVPKIGWMSTGYQGCIRAVRRKLKEIQPDIVHGQGTERDCAITAVFSGFPNVLTLHGNMRIIAEVNNAKPFSYNWLNARLETFTIPRSLGVICITRYTQEAVRGLARRTWVVPNSVDAKFFEIQRAPSPEKEILVVGAISYRKNQNPFIRALDPIAAKTPLKVTFLGAADKGDPYGREFFDLLSERPWCHWGGFASREQLREKLATTTALALPSLEDNCPMAVLEAMAAGVPVVAANVGGVPDLLDDTTGILCDPTNPESLRQSIQALLEFPEETQKRANRAREKAVRYKPSAVASQHVEIYRSVLSRP